jgi:GNAT superfamily N-acetyltransferase
MAKIREALPGEVERVLGMYEWLFAPPGSVPPRWDPAHARRAIAQAIEDPSAAVLVAEHRSELFGLCTAYLDLNSVRFGPRCWVEDLAVSPEHRSQGVGKALLDRAKEWARERGGTHLELDSADSRTDAHRFYEREGPGRSSRCFSWEL